MTCCVAINAKEGDCWKQLINCVLSLMLHKCHIRYQSFTELSHSAKCRRQFLPSALGHQREVGEVSLHRAHSVIEEKWRNQFSPSSLGHRRKDGEISFHRAHSVIEGKMEILVFTELTRSSQRTQCLPSSLGD